MIRLARMTPEEAHGALLKAGFELIRTKGSHRIYLKGTRRVVVPFHRGLVLHPKIVKQIFAAIEDTAPAH